ncbi:hypothetical protein AKO1_001897 [Acrasis kona]|uniref:ABM domain-containing protein n=1 Tax=Acrasis kona TaxID=1008807 RepID=A0AAW2ZBB5_9EUKA
MPLLQFVTLHLNEDTREKFDQVFNELIDTSVKSEEKTKCYYWFAPESGDKKNLYGVEIYEDESSWKEHMATPQFKKFVESVQSNGLFTQSFSADNYEPVVGFVDRPGKETPSAGQHVLIVDFVAKSSADRDGLFKEAQSLVDHVEKNEDGTISYLFTKSLEDDKKILIFEQYTSKSYLTDVHQQSEEFKKKSPLIAQYVSDRKLTHYTSVGLGFTSKK